MLNCFKTISSKSESEVLKIKKSKFIGYAIPISNEEEAKLELDKIKQKHPTASHLCYAYKIGIHTILTRVNDDGEPNNSAGKPILGQILAFDLNNILVVVVRYYGGTKLGVGGLISAYKESAKFVLSVSDIVEQELKTLIELRFKYDILNTVMRIAKQYDLDMNKQIMELDCKIQFFIPHRILEEVIEKFNAVYGLQVKGR